MWFVVTQKHNIVFGGVSIDKEIKEMFVTISDKTSNLEKIIQNLQKDMDFLKEYVLSTTKKHLDEELEQCYSHIVENKFITTEFIENDSILSVKYPDRQQQKRLFDEVIKRYDGLTESRHGQGQRRYIFKKEDEENIRKMLKHKKVTEKIKGNRNEYESIKNYFTNLDKEYYSTQSLHELLRKDFGIKTSNKIVNILRDLKRDRIIKSNSNRSGFYIMKRNQELIK